VKLSHLLILVALLALFLLALLVPGPWKQALWQAAYTVTGPVIHLLDKTKRVGKGFQEGLATLDQLEKEVAELRAANARLNTELTVLKDLATENSRLREMLGFKKSSQYRLLAARLVARDPSNWWSTVLVNRGYVDDATLQSDLPVVTARGVVGKTGTVSRDVTEVILLLNQNCKISGLAEESREQGILVGAGNAEPNKPRTRLTYVSRNARIGIGERVLTSGLGGVFPPGLLLGFVQEVPPLSPKVNFGLYREVTVEPAIDLSQVDEVFIILAAQEGSVPATKKGR
jgi:rod shape-determining protein MreC